MENTQALDTQQQPDLRHIEFHVSYLDTLSGRIEHAEFSDRAAAERFADAQLKDEDTWAVVDVVDLAAMQERAEQLVA